MEQIIVECDQSLAVRFTQHKLYLVFNHYRDIRANGKLRKIWPQSGTLCGCNVLWTAAEPMELPSLKTSKQILKYK